MNTDSRNEREAASPPLFDVVAVNIETRERRVIAAGLTERNADAFVQLAVIRRGVDTEFYVAEPQVVA